MIRKLMVLVAGALTALAFAALPAAVSAIEMTATCSEKPCIGNVVSTGETRLTDDSGLGIICSKTTGKWTQSATPSTTVTVELVYEGCKDSIFAGECNNAGAGTKKITANTLTGHLITATANVPTTAGVLLTGVKTTFDCPILGVEKTVTGNVIGTFENTASFCGISITNHTIDFTQSSAGQQTDKFWTGASFDLTSGTHAADGTTSSLTGTAHINYEGGKTVKIVC